jgi:GNAT superfamily N-acetyltransferase
LPVFDSVEIRIASYGEEKRVRAAYEALGYRRDLKLDTATVWIAETAEEIIGIVRIAEENGTLVLRGMRIAEAHQRRRVGSRLLIAIADWLGDRPCYCVPYSHLAGFYGQIGFVEMDLGFAPRFLAERVDEYRQNGLSTILMKRR